MFFPHRKVRRVTQSFFVFVSLCLCGSNSYANEILTVAVASSFYNKAKQYSQLFEQKHDVKVRLISGSTGRLYNQIRQGAPFDLFIAADRERPALLKGKNISVGSGYLGIQIGNRTANTLEELTHPGIKSIVIANTKTAPFGIAAAEQLKQAGLWEAIKPKLVYAQNAMQAAMMVDQGLVDAGFVPATKSGASVATIPYVGVLLSDNVLAQVWLNDIQSFGSEASASPLPYNQKTRLK